MQALPCVVHARRVHELDFDRRMGLDRERQMDVKLAGNNELAGAPEGITRSVDAR